MFAWTIVNDEFLSFIFILLQVNYRGVLQNWEIFARGKIELNINWSNSFLVRTKIWTKKTYRKCDQLYRNHLITSKGCRALVRGILSIHALDHLFIFLLKIKLSSDLLSIESGFLNLKTFLIFFQCSWSLLETRSTRIVGTLFATWSYVHRFETDHFRQFEET